MIVLRSSVCGLVLAFFAGACGGGSAPDAADESAVVGDGPAAIAVAAAGDDLSVEDQWMISRMVRDLDDLSDVVVYRSADEITGLRPGEDVVFFARCLGDRTQVEILFPVRLGDDLPSDGDRLSKRVLLRLLPANPTNDVWSVTPDGYSLLVEQPVRFLRQLVAADMFFVQTTSAQHTVLFASFAITPVAYASILAVSEACVWHLDEADEAFELQRDAEAVLEAQRQRVLRSYMSTPLIDGLERLGVNAGDIYIDMPAPVERAYLGAGLAVIDVELAAAAGLGLLCLYGEWVENEIFLGDCYPQDRYDVFRVRAPHLFEGVNPVLVDPDAERR